MTEKEIYAMEAGLAMDSLVATAIGWQDGYIPKFSTDISAAWKIVEKKLSEEFDYESRSLIGNQFAFIFFDLKDFDICVAGGVGYAHKITDIEAPWEWQAKAETLPLAICRAALLISLRGDPKDDV